MAKWVKRFNVKRKDTSTPGKVFWRKVGTAVQWEDGTLTLNLFMFPQEFKMFEDYGEEEQSPQEQREP